MQFSHNQKMDVPAFVVWLRSNAISLARSEYAKTDDKRKAEQCQTLETAVF